MSINRQMARGAFWTVGLRMFDRGIGFVSTLILVRLLMPEDFGLVAMATVFYSLLSAVSDFSVHVPLIQKDRIDRKDMDGAWTLQGLVGLGQGALLLAIAQPVSAFYGEPRLVSVMYALAAVASIGGLNNIGIVMFQREMAFDRDFLLRAVQRLLGFVVTIASAVIWRSYWALLIGMIASKIFGLILSYTMHPFRPRPSTARWRALIGFSKWMLLNNLFNFLGRRAPEFFLGRLFGARSVGLYSVSFEVSMLATTELAAPINRVALPGYSRMRAAGDDLHSGFLDVIGLIALIALPVAVGIAAIADLLVPILLGQKWLDAIPIIRYLAIAGAITVLVTNTYSVMLALGRPAVLTMQQLLKVILLLPGIYIGAMWGQVEGIAIAYLVVAMIMLIVSVSVALYALSLSPLRYLRVVYRPTVSVTVMYFVERAFVTPWVTENLAGHAMLGALVAVVFGATVFITLEVVLWRLAGRPKGAESRILQILSELLKDRAPSLSRWLETQQR